MRISVSGKGGSGKSTVSAALVQYLRSKSVRLLAVDADINRHLEIKLGVAFNAREIGANYVEVFKMMEGQNPILNEMSVCPELGTIPVTQYSTRPTFDPEEKVWKEFATVEGNMLFIRAGTYEEEDFGTACIHVKLKGLEMILHRLRDMENDFCVIDSTAGTDPLSTSLAYASDMHLLVVEPTRKSLNVFVDYVNMCAPIASRVFVIANKIQDSEDMDFIRSVIPSDRFLGMLPLSEKVRRAEQGQRQEFSGFVSENEALWVRCISQVRLAGRNEQEEIAAVNKLYISACKKWASEFYKKDLTLLAELGQDCLFNSEVV